MDTSTPAAASCDHAYSVTLLHGVIRCRDCGEISPLPEQFGVVYKSSAIGEAIIYLIQALSSRDDVDILVATEIADAIASSKLASTVRMSLENPPRDEWQPDLGEDVVATVNLTDDLLHNDDHGCSLVEVREGEKGKIVEVELTLSAPYFVEFELGGGWWVKKEWIRREGGNG